MKLKLITYKERDLVNLICTDAQKRAYQDKGHFPSGKHRSMFLDKLSQYCEYDYIADKREYAITEIFDYPKTLMESRIHKGIYQYLAPLILNEVLFGDKSKERKAVITSMDLAKIIGVVNDNYDTVKYNQDAMEIDLGFSSCVLAEYFNKADNRIDDYIRRCIKYLKSMNCVIYNETHMIRTFPKQAEIENGHVIVEPSQVRRATDDEMKLYSKLVDRASKKAGIENEQEKWYGKKAAKYNKILTALLKDNNIMFVCRSFELWRVDTDKCKYLMKEFAKDMTIEQRKQEIGVVLKTMMDSNAEKRLLKNPALGTDYLEQFQKLSDITLLYDADNIMKQLPSAKNKSTQEMMQDKFNFEIEYALSGGE